MSTDPVEFKAMAKRYALLTPMTRRAHTHTDHTHSLLASGTFADFTVICGEKHYQVHRALLMRHSAYFKTCFLSKFKEAEEGVIDLKVRVQICRFHDGVLMACRRIHLRRSRS